MHEYMKNALIAAWLVVSAAFAPCLSSVVDFPDPTSELACAAASPLFWQFWDELLSRERAHWTKTVSEDDQKSEWPLEFRNVPIYLLFQVFSNTRLKDPYPSWGN
jgi:FPC/CPF motif-containing protein YcgG